MSDSGTATTRRPSRVQLTLIGLGFLLLAIVVALLVDRIFFSSSDGTAGTGSGVAATQTRSLPRFSRVELTGANNVLVHVGSRQSVVVHGDRNLLSRVTTRVRSDTLVIGMTPGDLNARRPMFVVVDVPSLDRIGLQGAGNIAATGIDSPRLSVALPGSGNIDARGTATRLDVTISGQGTAALRGLTARTAYATLSGNGTIMVTATHRLTARISGSGTILYGGSPAHVAQSVTGTGTIGPG
jgi:hypothetical protein